MLKNDDTLLNELLSDENLKIAKQRVKKNKGASGIDGMEVKELDEYLSKHLDEIKEQIRNKKYSPKPVKRVEIPKPDGGVRNLGVPTVVDRFVQQAIAQVLTPIYEPKFSESSYGFRPNRCCEMAIQKALEFMNDGYQWVVDIDLEKFFDNVNHDKMISLINVGNLTNNLFGFYLFSLMYSFTLCLTILKLTSPYCSRALWKSALSNLDLNLDLAVLFKFTI